MISIQCYYLVSLNLKFELVFHAHIIQIPAFFNISILSVKESISFDINLIKDNQVKWRMLKVPPLKFLVLHFSILQNRPDRGPLMCSKYVQKSSKIS